MSREPRIAVVGAGIVGLATAYALQRAGEPVDLYERGAPGNEQSGGEGRIFRHGHDDPRLVELAKRSRAIWAEWERQLGVELVSADGVLALGERAERRRAVLERVGGVAGGRIEPAAAVERLPFLAECPEPAAFDAAGGAIRTTAAVAALSAALDDALIADEVIALRPSGGGVELRSGGAGTEYERVIVCAGRGTAAFARGLGLSLPVEPAAHLRLGFPARGPSPQRAACLQDGSGGFGETGIYATPEPGNDRYGVGLGDTAAVAEDGSVIDPEALAGHERRLRDYVARALPGLDPEPVEHRHCWVTELPWSSDGLAIYEHGAASFVAGHNLFKLAPAIAAALAAAAGGAELDPRLRPGARLGDPGAATAD